MTHSPDTAPGGENLTQLHMARLVAEKVEELGLTQAEFGRRVGATPKHVNTVFSGKSQAYMATLDYWAFILGCRWDVHLVPIDGSTDA